MDQKKYNIKPFDGERYSIWKFRMRSVLEEQNCLRVIDEENPSDLNEGWLGSERTAKSLIVQYLSDSMLGFAKSESKAKEIFKDLDSIYERKSLASQLSLRKKLLSLKLKCDEDLKAHFITFDEIVTELLAAGAKLDEMDKVSHLLLTMPSAYDGVITAMETLSEDNLTLSFVKTRLLDQEIKIKNECKDTSAKVLNTVVQKPFRNNKNMFKNKSKRVFKPYQNKKNDKRCHHCGRLGHFKIDCFHYKKQQQKYEQQQQQQQHEKYKDNQNVVNAAITQPTASGSAFMLRQVIEENNASFVLDSGASDHMIKDANMFIEYIDLQPPIKIAVAKCGQYIYATKKGIVQLFNDDHGHITLEDVLYCEKIPQNILSVYKIQDAGHIVEFKGGCVTVKRNGKTVMNGNFCNCMPIVNLKIYINKSLMILNKDMTYRLWHERLGHISKGKFTELKSKKLFSDIDLIESIVPRDELCEACISGKQARLKFKKSKDKQHIKRPLFVVHSDVCGPITPQTIDSKNYYVIFIDEFTHYVVTYLITYKSEVFSVFKDFVSKSETFFNFKLVNLYIDNGREYLSNEMKEFCIKKGITYHLTVPHTPQLNGVAERMIRTITEKARSMVSGAKLEKTFWGEAVLTATYIINRTPSNALKICKTPYEMWHKKKPILKYLKVFGATVYVHNKVRKTKFEEKSWKGILVGYMPNGYKLWDVENGKFVTARDVIFDEINVLGSRPFNRVTDVNSNNNKITTPDFETGGESKFEERKSNKVPSEVVNNEENTNAVGIDHPVQVDTEEYYCSESDLNSKRHRDNDNSRKSERISKLPKVSYNEDDLENCLMSAQSFVESIPETFDEIATRSDKASWEKAILEELESHESNKTWTIIERPINKNIVDCRWVFTIKHDELGNPMKYKARLVARGFTQRYLIDYDETFAPVARVASFRFLLAFSVQFGLMVHHMDVKTAFLNGVLKEEIYMSIPQGIKCGNNKVCKLNKAIYGLKQAARCWFEMFEFALKEHNFIESAVDRCIYVLDRGDVNKNIYVLLYVDDVIISTKDANVLTNFKKYLMCKFHMKDLMEVKYFIGIRIEYTYKTISLSQSAYIQNVLNKFNMQNCKPVGTPLPSQIDYEKLNSEEQYKAPCRQLIGCLMYIMLCTRPDISAAVNILSRYSNKNNQILWMYLKRVLRYLKGIGYTDSDWGGCEIDRRSTTGFLFKIFENCSVSWCTKKQNSVAASSTEAEYMALFEAVREALWLKSLAESIKLNIDMPITIFEDNQGCISIASNPSCHKRSKHIDIKFHFSREQVENKVIKLLYIPTEAQLADVLTKPLPEAKFSYLRNQVGLIQNKILELNIKDKND